MKKLLLLFLSVLPCLCVQSQSQSDSIAKQTGTMILKLSEGWFVGASGGAQVYWGAEDKLAPFGDRVSPTFSVYAGKWLSPLIGLRLGYDGINTKGFSQNPSSYTNGAQRPDGLYENNYDYNHLHVDLLYNFSENVCKENLKRIYSFIPYAGIGLMQMAPKGGRHGFFGADNEFVANFGIINKFRITQNFSANIELQAMIMRGGISNVRPRNGKPSIADVLTPLKVGVAYRFGKVRSKRAVEIGAVETLQSDLREAVAQKEQLEAIIPTKDQEISKSKSEINSLKDQIVSLKSKKSDIEQINVATAKFVVFFGGSSYFISSKDKVTLRYAAEAIKKSNQPYLISAYADSQTGDPKHNQAITELRAEAIYKILVETHGINPELLTKVANGQNNAPHESYRLNRVAVIEPANKK